MKKMLDKTVIDLKLSAHICFTMLYLGARAKISKHITKATLISTIIESACVGRQEIVFYDQALKSYNLAELIKIGENLIRDSFMSFMNDPGEVYFYVLMSNITNGYKHQNSMLEKVYKDHIHTDEMKRHIASSILTESLKSINLRDTDIENIVNVILIDHNVLGVEKEGDDHKSSYLFSREQEPYTCFKEVKAIIQRFENIKHKISTLEELSALFKKVLDEICQKHGYENVTSNPDKKDDFELFDSNMDFWRLFTEELESINLCSLSSEDEIAALRKNYKEMIMQSQEADSLRNCSGCGPCVFDERKCLDAWIKKQMAGWLRSCMFAEDMWKASLSGIEINLLRQFLPEGTGFRKK